MVADRGPVTFSVTVAFLVIATIFVAARFFTRIFIVRSLKQEDWWILAAWVVALGFSVSICVGVRYGLGLHNRDINSILQHEGLRKVQYAFSVLYNPSLILTKTSIIIFFLNVMSKDVDPIFKWCNYLTLVLVITAGVALTFLNIFQCSPVSSAFLYPTPINAKCADIVTLYLSSAPVNIVTDLAILLLPMPILTGMRLQRKQKLILIVTFGCGVFVAAVDVVRITYLQEASVQRLAAAKSGSQQGYIRAGDDFSWYASFTFMWSAVEVNLGIICACVPTLKPLFVRFLPIFVHDVRHRSRASETIEDQAHVVAPEPVPVKGSLNSLNNPAGFRKPVAIHKLDEEGINTIGFPDMLDGTEVISQTPKRASTGILTTSSQATAPSASNFGFVIMDKKRNMLKLSNKESLWPLAAVIVIFFLWGTAYGLLDTLNAKFESVAYITVRQALGLHAAYFSGYFVGPLTLGHFVLRRYGFKPTMMVGLCVYGCGALTFWPSAVLTSYPAFLVSNFIVAFGLSCLEIAANPYMALCGPLEYAETRLCFGQGFQSIGTIVAPLLAQKVFFTDVTATALVDVQWAYLGIAFFVIGLAVVFYYIPLPEASDEQLQARAQQRSTVYSAPIGPYPVIWWTLALGVFSQWTYVGGQEVIRSTTQKLYNLMNPKRTHPSSLSSFDIRTVSSTVYMTGRFLCGFATLFVEPRKVLFLLYAGLIPCCTVQIFLTSTAAIVLNPFIYLCASGIFSLTFAIVLRGMGKHTKLASALVTTAISGGAIFPIVQWATENCCGLRFSFVVPVVIFSAGALFPVYLNTLSTAKAQVDPKGDVSTREGQQACEGGVYGSDGGGGGLSLRGLVSRGHHEKSPKTNEPSSQHFEIHGVPSNESTISPAEGFGPPSGRRDEDILPVLDLPEISKPVQLHQPSGIVGELRPWP